MASESSYFPALSPMDLGMEDLMFIHNCEMSTIAKALGFPQERPGTSCENPRAVMPIDDVTGRGTDAVGCHGASKTRRGLQAIDHIMAERKRRERLSEMFVSLSAIVPGLKKMDKASILGDAIEYVKELQKRVAFLENKAKSTMESVVLVKKSRLSTEANTTFSNEDEDCCNRQPRAKPVPEIEARVSDDTVLLKIHCKKQRGVTVKILGEIERLHLTVTGINVLPFAASGLDITITAQMEEEFGMTVKDLVKNLSSTFNHFT